MKSPAKARLLCSSGYIPAWQKTMRIFQGSMDFLSGNGWPGATRPSNRRASGRKRNKSDTDDAGVGCARNPFSAAKVWLLLTLGIPAAVITALVVFYLVMRAMHG